MGSPACVASTTPSSFACAADGRRPSSSSVRRATSCASSARWGWPPAGSTNSARSAGRTGDLEAAEAAYCEALELGHESQPGLALLRLAQGDVTVACASIADALADEEAPAQAGLRRARLLAAQVEIALAAGDAECARAATDELQAIAERYASTALAAEAATAQAALALADGGSALTAARRAHRLWQQLEMPYEAARARLLVAAAQRAAGHDDAARLQLQAAATTFERLGAGPDLEIAQRTLGGKRTAATLTRRERDVLALVADGLTDRQIAERLVVSPHTVHRHLANIRGKLGQPTRAATVAQAARLGLL